MSLDGDLRWRHLFCIVKNKKKLIFNRIDKKRKGRMTRSNQDTAQKMKKEDFENTSDFNVKKKS